MASFDGGVVCGLQTRRAGLCSVLSGRPASAGAEPSTRPPWRIAARHTPHSPATANPPRRGPTGTARRGSVPCALRRARIVV